ncbi:Six-hairpin glycosidase [Fomitopsis betulina]|nr:Six-hairpin glycosidase [Fomitopsis betulina]
MFWSTPRIPWSFLTPAGPRNDIFYVRRQLGHRTASNGTPTASYEHGEFQSGLKLLYERTGNQSYYDYIVEAVDGLVSDNGTVGGDYPYYRSTYQLDPLRVGPTFLYLYSQTGDERYKAAADEFRSQLDTQPRTPEGWADGLYMADLFYALYTVTFQPNNQSAWDDIANQFAQQFTHTIQLASSLNTTNNETNVGLLYHGFDDSRVQNWASPDRGHSPEVWDRAVGWYVMALVDILDLAPQTHETLLLRQTLNSQLQVLARNLVKAADSVSGVWWIVMSQPGRAGNYFESSGSSMFIYALLKGDGSFVATARKAYEYATHNWVLPQPNGTMNWNNTVVVGSLQPGNDYDYYISEPVDLNDLKGLAAFVLASIEYETLSNH